MSETANKADAVGFSPMSTGMDHPCFSESASTVYGRIHLPVAESCNIQCNFCNRRFDCAAESRPGVSSKLLTPEMALARLEFVLEKSGGITVAGIAGPGDPLANYDQTLRTLKLVKSAHPELKLCISTNGLMLERYLIGLLDAGVSHITITINSFRPETVSKIVSWVSYAGHIYTGLEAAMLLIERQRSALKALEGTGVGVKINIVLIPGINESDIRGLVDELAGYRAVSCVNIMPFIPVKGAVFEHLNRPDRNLIQSLRTELEPKIPQIRHCCQCRSDAIGLLGCDRSDQFMELMTALNEYEIRSEALANGSGLKVGTKVAVSSTGGLDVDQHFGHSESFRIYSFSGTQFEFVEERKVVPFCTGEELSNLIGSIADCTVIICTKIGNRNRAVLESAGFAVIEAHGGIDKILMDLISRYDGNNRIE